MRIRPPFHPPPPTPSPHNRRGNTQRLQGLMARHQPAATAPPLRSRQAHAAALRGRTRLHRPDHAQSASVAHSWPCRCNGPGGLPPALDAAQRAFTRSRSGRLPGDGLQSHRSVFFSIPSRCSSRCVGAHEHAGCMRSVSREPWMSDR